MEKLSRLCDISSRVGKCWAMCSGQAVEMLWSALSAALPKPCWLRWVQRNLSIGSSSPLWLLIHSHSSPSNSILVCLTAMCVFSGRLRMASTTCGTTSFSSGRCSWRRPAWRTEPPPSSPTLAQPATPSSSSSWRTSAGSSGYCPPRKQRPWSTPTRVHGNRRTPRHRRPPQQDPTVTMEMTLRIIFGKIVFNLEILRDLAPFDSVCRGRQLISRCRAWICRLARRCSFCTIALTTCTTSWRWSWRPVANKIEWRFNEFHKISSFLLRQQTS